ncbi:MAG: fumarylacetoacetate hydrolase family protein, partial [Acidimicrobiales bacterium]
MQIGTIRANGETRAARLDGNRLTLLPFADVGAVLRADALDAAHAASGESVPVANADWAPLVTHPEKIVCVGLNYREHIRETGSDTPAYPTYFAKYRRALIGANDEIRLPAVSTKVDWEIELCIVIGREGRNIDAAQALDHVAGYSILNDTSMRDFQRRTKQFLAG